MIRLAWCLVNLCFVPFIIHVFQVDDDAGDDVAVPFAQ